MAQSASTLSQVPLGSAVQYGSSPLNTIIDGTQGLGLDSSPHAHAHSIPGRQLDSLFSVVGGRTEVDMGGQKMTLITRPHPASSIASNQSMGSIGHALEDEVVGPMSIVNNMLPPGDGSPQLLLKGTRNKDDYYDTEDPSVNLHDFIINSLQAQKNRVILLQLEEEFLSYVRDPTRMEPFRLPSWDSYHRMLAHRVAAYFGLEHNVDPQDKTRVVVAKGPHTRIPIHRFVEYIPVEETDPSEPKLILKRIRENSAASDKYDNPLMANQSSDIKSFEEREEAYEKARARIFNQTPSQLQVDTSAIPFDLISSSSMGLTSALRSTFMHHRRAASDTSFLNRLMTTKEVKQGPSSSGNSPIQTPAFLPPSPTLSSSAPTHNTIKDVTQILHQQQQQPRAITRRPSRPPPPSYMPLYNIPLQTTPSAPPTAAIPVFYPQPAAVVDPNWYYNHMVLYPLSPGAGYIPAQYSPVVQSPVVPVYGSHPVIGGQIPPGRSGSGMGMRVPVATSGSVVEHVTSPVGSGMVIRPVPQQPTGSHIAKPEDYNNPSSAALGALWNTHSHSPYANHLSAGQVAAAQQYAAATSMMPQLAEQLEKGMVISDPAMAAAHNSMKREAMQNSMLADVAAAQGYMGDHKMSPIGQQKHPFVPTSNAMMGGGARGRNGGGVVHGPMSPGLYNYFPMMQPGLDPMSMSPTQIAPPSQYLPQHLPPGFSPDQATVAAMAAASQHHLSYPTGLPLHSQDLSVTPTPGTPTLAPPMPSLHHSQGSAQGLFSPPNSITHSPVQILGHTLSTSIFSPPPSAAPAHGMFINNPGKPSSLATNSPSHAPVGSGSRSNRFESPKRPDMSFAAAAASGHAPTTQAMAAGSRGMTAAESSLLQQQKSSSLLGVVAGGSGGSHIVDVSGNGVTYQSQQLPPRLARGGGGGGGVVSGTRYQNQRHPSNRPPITKIDHPGPQPYTPPGVRLITSGRKEGLLPTPSEMIKLDIGITAGVPVHVMEVLHPPSEDSPDHHKVIQLLKSSGALDFSRGWMNCGAEVMVAIFETPEAAMKALKVCALPSPMKLSIPLPTHAKFILQLLENQAGNS